MPEAKDQLPYRVLARKYRPVDFTTLIGQEAMVRTLRNAIASGRIAHAFMLTGVRGVGKTTTARILARALNYQLPDGSIKGPTVNMPVMGIHDQHIMDSRHIDVLEMDAASHNGVDDIRQINDAVRYAPVSARYKVYIIDEVHMLSKQAFNGLLKTLGTDINEWNNAAEKMYARGSTPEFWAAEGQLSALERMQFGVTTSITLFGGGNDVYRTDDPRYGEAYLNAVKDVGVRWFLAVGPGRGPFPQTFTDWTGASPRDVPVTFEKQMEVSEGLIKKWNGAANGRMKMAVVFPTSNPSESLSTAALAERKARYPGLVAKGNMLEAEARRGLAIAQAQRNRVAEGLLEARGQAVLQSCRRGGWQSGHYRPKLPTRP